MIESSDWKYIRHHQDRIAGDIQEELFNLRNDPNETINILANTQTAQTPEAQKALFAAREHMLRIFESSPACQCTYDWRL